MSTSHKCALLIGGAGFVGENLTLKLIKSGYHVVIIDIVKCPKNLIAMHKCLYFNGDASNKDFLIEVMTTCPSDIVFMIASFGMSGRDMLNKKCIEINQACVTEVIKACTECNVSKLVYTSSYNVVFGGQEIVNGDESIPYFPINRHTDYYSASKCIAESLILQANKTKLRKGGLLTTVALRPAAIYGEGEQRHLPRLIKHVDGGLFIFRIGNAIVDWIHIDNLSHAYVCTASTLFSYCQFEHAHPTVGGQAYFISDGSPINNFEFLRPLCEARGCHFPQLVIPTSVCIYIAYCLEKLYLFTKLLNLKIGTYSLVIEPFLVRAEVYKVGITHFATIKKAETDLGYQPLFHSAEGASRLAHYYSQLIHMDDLNYFRFAPMTVYMSILLAVLCLGLTGYDCVRVIPVWCQPLQSIAMIMDIIILIVFPTRTIVCIIFWLAHIIHVCEAIYTYYLAVSMGCHNTKWLWCMQTALLGYFSFSLLYSRQKFIDIHLNQMKK